MGVAMVVLSTEFAEAGALPCSDRAFLTEVEAVGVTSGTRSRFPSLLETIETQAANGVLRMNSRACKAGALPAELHAPCNCMILKMILIEFRENDYLPSRQVLSQAELQAQRVQPSADQILTAISGSEQNVSCRFWALCSL